MPNCNIQDLVEQDLFCHFTFCHTKEFAAIVLQVSLGSFFEKALSLLHTQIETQRTSQISDQSIQKD